MAQTEFLVVGAILLLGSGLGIAGLIGGLRRALTPIETIPCALLLSSGVTGLWALLGRTLSLPLGPWSTVLLAMSLLLLFFGSIARLRNRRETRIEMEPAGHRFGLIALALLAFLLMLHGGGSLGPIHDSLDFVAFVNESLQTGELAPDSPIYKASPDLPPDPRRGSFHSQIAAICQLTGTRPTDAWHWLPSLLVPLAVLGIGAMYRPWLGSGVAWLATALFIATTFFTRDHFIQNLGYASRFGWICGWAALLALGQGLALRARARWSESNALLFLAAASPAILMFVHLLSGFQVLLALCCAGGAVWTWKRSDFEAHRSVWFVLIGGTVLMAPVVAWRIAQGTSVDNLLFDHLYGVVLVADGWPILHPDYLTDRFGIAGIIGAILALFLLVGSRRNRIHGFLFFSTAVPLLILFFPPIVRFVVASHAHSMLFRVILTIPFSGTLAWCVTAALKSLRKRRPWKPAPAIVVLLAIAIGLIAQGATTRSEWAVPERKRQTYRENEALVGALQFLEQNYSTVQTVLSDPITSYAIPAYTRHDAVAPLHQHSSPFDPTVPERIRDVQEVLNGRIGLKRTLRILRRYDVDLILLNQSWSRYQSDYYVFISPLAYPEQKVKFGGAPDLFRPVYDRNGVLIYSVHDTDSTIRFAADPPNRASIPDPGGVALLSAGPVELLEIRPDPTPHRQGDPIRFDLIWRRTTVPYTLPVICEIKLQHEDLPRGYNTPIVGLFTRWWDEHRDGTRLRFGRPFRPLATFYPDFLWLPGETYKDEYWEHIPPNARPGGYVVWVRLGIEPYAPVDELREVTSNWLGKDWIRFGGVRINGR